MTVACVYADRSCVYQCGENQATYSHSCARARIGVKDIAAQLVQHMPLEVVYQRTGRRAAPLPQRCTLCVMCCNVTGLC